MLGQRFVDIKFPTGAYGSGYLLTNSLVMTARHVTQPFGLGAQCSVGGPNVAGERRLASLRWFSDPSDIALLTLVEPLESELGPEPRFGRLSEEHDSFAIYPCTATGFPFASKRWKKRVEHVFSGRARRLSSPDLFEIEVTVAPRQAAGWAGFSGSAILSGGLLFAIAIELPEEWGGKLLVASPLEPLLDDAEFRSVLLEYGLSHLGAEPLRRLGHYEALSRRIDKQFCWVNREDQERIFRERISLGDKSFVFEATMDDRPELLIERMELDRFHSAREWDPPSGRKINQIPWPGFHLREGEAEILSLKALLVNRLALDVDPKADPQAFCEALRLRGPCAIWWTLDPALMGPGHAALLQQWTRFCAQLQEADISFFWFACWVRDTPIPTERKFSIVKRVAPDPEVEPSIQQLVESGKAVSLDLLRSISPLDDVPTWLERLREEARLTHDASRDVHFVLHRQLDGVHRPLRQFAIDVQTALRGSNDQHP